MRTLVRKALQELNRPATPKEILQQIQKTRPDVKSKSISTIVNMYYFPLLDNTYILPEWKEKYGHLIKRQIRVC
jgi:hypothetical protein